MFLSLGSLRSAFSLAQTFQLTDYFCSCDPGYRGAPNGQDGCNDLVFANDMKQLKKTQLVFDHLVCCF